MEEEKLTSQYNEAGLQILRLHGIWTESKILREKGLLISYKWKLDSAMLELMNDAKKFDEKEKEKEKQYVSKLNSLDQEIALAENQKEFTKMYKKLLEKESLLRWIQDKCGKGGKYRPEDDDDI